MQEVIDLGCVPVLLQFMRESESRQLQLEATWILTNIACGRSSQCQSIIDKQGLEVLFSVVSQKIPHVSEQAMWGISNIAADCPKFRDIILGKGGLDVIIQALGECENITMLEQGVWVISNLCRGTPKPKYQLIKKGIPVLANLVLSGMLPDQEVALSLWAIANNSETQKSRIQQLVDIKGFIPYLLQRMQLPIAS